MTDPHRRSRRSWLLAAGIAAVLAPSAAVAATAPTIVLIGGAKQGYPRGEHDYPDGVLKIERLIKASPEFAKVKPVIKTYPAGFPKNLSEIDDASVVLLYFGMDYKPTGHISPVQDPAVKAGLNRLMARGVGLIALHQAFTVPDAKADVPYTNWLGGIRIGMADRTTEIAPISITTQSHPIASGLTSFEYLDEFYPTINMTSSPGVTPILSARVHVQHRDNKPVFEDPASNRVVAWAYERSDGGRAFAFSGAHELSFLDQPQVRKMVLNAVLWASKNDVPAAGVTTTVPAGRRIGQSMPDPADYQRVVLPAAEVTPEPQTWGKLEWFASRPLGNSATMTVGQATISVGKENPVHWHPNCDEILHVLKGHIMHRVGDKEYEMKAGDTVVIPEGQLHNARNIGSEDAVLLVSFNSADRVAIGE